MVNTEFGDRRYHRSMSDHPPSGPTSAHGASGYPGPPAGFPGAPAGTPPWSPPPPRGPSRWLTFLALAIAVIATGLAIVGWFRPSLPPPAAAPTYTEQQISDAKARACAAFDVVKKGHYAFKPIRRRATTLRWLMHKPRMRSFRSWLGGCICQGSPRPSDTATIGSLTVHKLASTLVDIGVKPCWRQKRRPPQAALHERGKVAIASEWRNSANEQRKQ